MSIGKAKNILGKAKFDKISERARILKDLTGKSLNTLGVEAGISNGTAGDWSDNQIEKPTRAVSDFLTHHGINEDWWKTGEGEVFNKNSTYVELPSDNKQNQEMEPDKFFDTIRTVVEGKTEYLLVPRGVLKDHYRLVSLEQYEKDMQQIEKDKQQINKDIEQMREMVRKADETIAAKEQTIATLNRLISTLERSPTNVHPQQSQ
jgi:hypothetical protein